LSLRVSPHVITQWLPTVATKEIPESERCMTRPTPTAVTCTRNKLVLRSSFFKSRYFSLALLCRAVRMSTDCQCAQRCPWCLVGWAQIAQARISYVNASENCAFFRPRRHDCRRFAPPGAHWPVVRRNSPAGRSTLQPSSEELHQNSKRPRNTADLEEKWRVSCSPSSSSAVARSAPFACCCRLSSSPQRSRPGDMKRNRRSMIATP
jgi:hypothetical protein